jgi:lysozyme family protein
MRNLSADKPVDISIMQTMLKDVCDKSIAIDGQVGDQTVAAMKQAMEKFKSKIPGYRE